MRGVGGIGSRGREPLPAWDCESLLTVWLCAQCVGRGGRWEAAAQRSRGVCGSALGAAPGVSAALCTAACFSERWGTTAPVLHLSHTCLVPVSHLSRTLILSPCRPASWVFTGPLWTTTELPWKQQRSAVRPMLNLQKSLRYAGYHSARCTFHPAPAGKPWASCWYP